MRELIEKERQCSQCGGEGMFYGIVSIICSWCDGTGREKYTEFVELSQDKERREMKDSYRDCCVCGKTLQDSTMVCIWGDGKNYHQRCEGKLKMAMLEKEDIGDAIGFSNFRRISEVYLAEIGVDIKKRCLCTALLKIWNSPERKGEIDGK